MARLELGRELAAQFERFAASGLPLSHVDSHLHLHMHPSVFNLLLPLAEAYGAHGLRLPRDDLRLSLSQDRRQAGTKVAWAVLFGLLSRRSLAWALTFRRQLTQSLQELAVYVQCAPECQDMRAFRGEISFGGPYTRQALAHMLERWGFDLVSQPGPARLWGRLNYLVQNAYAWALMWAFNPASLKEASLWDLRRDQVWISRGVLLGRYAVEGFG